MFVVGVVVVEEIQKSKLSRLRSGGRSNGGAAVNELEQPANSLVHHERGKCKEVWPPSRL